MGNSHQDNAVIKHITQLTEREEELYGKADVTNADVSELHSIQLELDQYWDFLRQRRALRDAGRNTKHAEKRPIDQIEHYEK